MVRVKHRYLLLTILYPSAPATPSTSASTNPSARLPLTIHFSRPSPSQLTPQTFGGIIRQSIAQNFGDWGLGLIGSLAVKYFSPATSTAIVRIARDHHRLLWAALTFVKEIYGQPVVIKVVKVSGTIRKAEEEAIRLAEATIERVKEQEKTGIGVPLGIFTGGGGGKEEEVPGSLDVEMSNMVYSDGEDDDDDEGE